MTFVPERWDTGLWDEAHWDGQLGIDAAAAAVTITTKPANLVVTHRLTLNAVSTPVTITPQLATFSIGRKLTAARAQVVITPQSVNLVVSAGFYLFAQSTPVTITPQTANLVVTHHLTLATAPASVVITGNVADLTVYTHHLVMQALTAQVRIIPMLADLEVGRSLYPFPQPGRITMGIPKYFVDRW